MGAIPTLTSEEQAQVGAALKAAQAMGAAGQVSGEKPQRMIREEAPEHVREVLQFIISYMMDHKLDRTKVDDALNSTHGREFAKKTPAVWAFVTEHTKNRAGAQTMLMVAVKLLHADLMDMGIAVSTRTMMAHVHRLPALINRQFPGYAASGLLKLFATRKRVHEKEDES